ncbi:MAG: tyrosine-type recombinase/integrase [Halobacteriaceae archaeon]
MPANTNLIAKQGQRRPLLLAEPSVRNWIELHPDKHNPDAYLITAHPRYSTPDPTEPVDHTVLTYLMDKLKDETGIQKPLHPHSLRHNFVTICKRDYDMDNDVIKHLIGHNPGSRVMETTYAHLDDDDYIEAARKAIGKAEEEDSSPLTPQICPNCGSNVPDGAKACTCGVVFAPDAPGLRQQAEDRIVEIETEQKAAIVQAVLEDLRENPEEYTGE